MKRLKEFDVYQLRLAEAATVASLTSEQLWLRYIALSGVADALEVEGYLWGLTTLEDTEHNILTEVVNERLIELGCRPAALYKGLSRVHPAAAPTQKYE